MSKILFLGAVLLLGTVPSSQSNNFSAKKDESTLTCKNIAGKKLIVELLLHSSAYTTDIKTLETERLNENYQLPNAVKLYRLKKSRAVLLAIQAEMELYESYCAELKKSALESYV